MFRKLRLIYLLFASMLCFGTQAMPQGNWKLALPPGPTSNQMVSLHFIDHQTGWAVGEYGTILKTTDGGNNWRMIPVPWLTRLLDVYFPTPTVGYIVGQDGLILKSADGGETWTQPPVRFTSNFARVRFWDANTGWIIGEKGLILHTTDGGVAWFQQVSNCGEDLRGIACIDRVRLCVVGRNESILLSEDAGQNWRRIKPAINLIQYHYDFNDICFLDANRGWIGGESPGFSMGILLTTTNGGQSWQEKQVDSFRYSEKYGDAGSSSQSNAMRIQQIYFTDAQHGLALTANRDLFSELNVPLCTNNGGKNWYGLLIGSNESCDQPGRLAWLGDSTWVNTGYGGEFRFSRDHGKTWRFPNAARRALSGFKIGNHGQLLAQQSRVEVPLEIPIKYNWLVSEDFGQHWQVITPQFFDPQGNSLQPAFFNDAGRFIGTRDSLWTVVTLAADQTEYLFKSGDLGRTWYRVRGGANSRLSFLTRDTLFTCRLNPEEIAYNTYKSVLYVQYSLDGGRTVISRTFNDLWNDITPYDPWDATTWSFISQYYFLNGRVGFLVGSDGNIVKTENTGQSWRSVPSNVVEHLWGITFITSKIGFAVGNYGRILKTGDGGLTWRKTQSGTQENIYAIAFKNEWEGWVGTSTGLRYTTDGGETWQGVALRYQHGLVRNIGFDDFGNGYAYTTRLDQTAIFGSHKIPDGYDFLLYWPADGVPVVPTPSTPAWPRTAQLPPNYPNPFNAATRITFDLPAPGPVDLKIYNLQGQLVRGLVAAIKPAGIHTVIWDGYTEQGASAASGVYLYVLQCPDATRARKMILLR
ncbi:YCF48-related protein [candidate division KSB1 bacterium]|nr:YCF48-related protein [candidate division KSB1 bacterium]